MTVADDYFLVPMQIDVMVLNTAASAATPFLRFQMDYSNLQTFTSPEPAPFDATESTLPNAGIYLHWTLPKALRHGLQQDDGTTSFPFVPNRWLIVRTQAGVAPAQAVKAWVLESDYLDPTNNTGTSPFIDPATGNPATMGRARVLSTIDSIPIQGAPFLQVIGPGSATFAVYSPAVENIFAFVDNVTGADGVTVITNGVFTYSVAGWYSDPAHDPIGDPDLQWAANPALAGTYSLQPKPNTNPVFNPDWYVYAANNALPTKMITHSQTSGVPWSKDADNANPPGFPTDIQSKVKVAIGNTAIDALSALISPDPNGPLSTEATLLQAFQYNLLDTFDEPGSADALKMEIRKHWFGASPGGTLWTVAVAERSGDTSLPAPPPPALTTVQQQNLAALNQAQTELDRQTRILESMQWNLLGLWWKYNYSTANPDICFAADDHPDLMAQLAFYAQCNNACGSNPPQTYDCQVKAQQALVASCQAAANAAVGTMNASLDLTQLILKAAEKPSYYYANDPVILISGLGAATNFDPTGDVLCRLPSQTLGSLTVSGTLYSVDGSGGTDISANVPVLADPKNLLPAPVQLLNRENYLLSPWLFASEVLQDPNPCPGTPNAPSDDPILDQVTTAIAAIRATQSNGQYAPPDYAADQWVQPWVPVLMDWQVDVLEDPAYSSDNSGNWCDFNGSNWQFNGADFDWTGPTSASGNNFDPAHSVMTIMGRTFITPHLSTNLAAQLQTYITKHAPRDPELMQMLQTLENELNDVTIVRDTDLLSQRLSGMMAGMVQRSYRQNPSPPASLVSLFGDTHRGFPNPYPDERSEGTPATWDFAPLSGAFFLISGLTVIDSFGRSIDLMLANSSQYPGTQDTQPANYFFPYTSAPMTNPVQVLPGPDNGEAKDATQQMVQLAPRLIQDSQLRLTLLSNDGANQDINLSPGANPVCGWFVPNHLDRSLAVYAPDGTAWGELFLSLHGDRTYDAVWQGDPTSSTPRTIADFPSPYIREILNSLTNHVADNGFYDLLKAIDETLWTIAPRGQRKDQDLSVLIGRPLAVVRMDASLKLRGLPYAIQDWEQTFDMTNIQPGTTNPPPAPLLGQNAAILDYTWPVLLGSTTLRDDGLIGYFLDDPNQTNTWNTFHAVNLPADATSPFLQQLDPTNCLQLKFTDDTVTAPDAKAGQTASMTLLLDPRGLVHAFSGVLPVATTQIPDQFVTSALRKMSYCFRIGPLLTTPDQVRLPRPAERKGTWTWFDNVLQTSVSIVNADGNVRIGNPAPVAKEGWLKLTPNPPLPADSNKK